MLKGTITCACGQLFGFTSEEEELSCPSCGNVFTAIDYVDLIEEILPVEELPLSTEEAPLTEGSADSDIDF